MPLSQAQQKAIQNFCMEEPKTVSQILSQLKLSGTKALMSLYNYFKTQKAKILFFIENKGGFVWVRTNPLNFFDKTARLDNVDKQSSPQTKNPQKTENGKTYKPLTGLNRASPERVQAALIMNRLNKFGYYNKETKQFVYTTEAKNEIDSLFKSYCSRVQQEKIILARAPDNDPVFASEIQIPYKTRFTSQQRQQENLNGFRAAFTKASRKHMKGVYLTLTAQPSASKTLWEANKELIQAWGKMDKFLIRHIPERADLICVREFQQNGRLHFHILIFGINWLLHKSVIQYAWVKYGGGHILDIHTVRQDPSGWVWARSCPLEAAGSEPQTYLSRYLEKSMSPLHGSLYWVMGVRNWTANKRLLPEKAIKSKVEPVKTPAKKYFLKGVLSSITGFRISHRKDSMSLYGAQEEAINNSLKESSSSKKITEPKHSLTFQKATELYLKQTHTTED